MLAAMESGPIQVVKDGWETAYILIDKGLADNETAVHDKTIDGKPGLFDLRLRITSDGRILCVDSMIKDDALAAYSFGELVYHIIQLSDDGFLATDYRFHGEQQKEKFPAPRIFYVTPKGHNFVSETYEKQRWNSVKKALSAVGSVSLPVMEQVAGSIATAAISQLLTGGNVTGA